MFKRKKNYIPKTTSAPRFLNITFGASKSLENLFPEDDTLLQHPIKGYKGSALEDGWSKPRVPISSSTESICRFF